MPEAHRTVVVPGSPEGVRRAVDDFEAFAAANGLHVNTTWPIHVALDEILSNVVRHAYRGRPDGGRIEVRFGLQAGELELVITDDAGPFDPLAVAEPDTGRPAEDRPVGGLGIFFVRRLMDCVEYRRRDGRNELTCRKRVVG